MRDTARRALEEAIEKAWHEYHGPIHMAGEDDYFPAPPPLFKRGFVEGVEHAKRERDEARALLGAAKESLNAIHVAVGGWIAAMMKEGK